MGENRVAAHGGVGHAGGMAAMRSPLPAWLRFVLLLPLFFTTQVFADMYFETLTLTWRPMPDARYDVLIINDREIAPDSYDPTLKEMGIPDYAAEPNPHHAPMDAFHETTEPQIKLTISIPADAWVGGSAVAWPRLPPSLIRLMGWLRAPEVGAVVRYFSKGVKIPSYVLKCEDPSTGPGDVTYSLDGKPPGKWKEAGAPIMATQWQEHAIVDVYYNVSSQTNFSGKTTTPALPKELSALFNSRHIVQVWHYRYEVTFSSWTPLKKPRLSP
jgi:hypothetical protein